MSRPTSDQRIDAFVEHVRQECRESNIKFVLTKGDGIMVDGLSLTGCFEYPSDGEPGRLKVAGKNERWVEVLAHEFGHLLQWKTQAKVWFNDSNFQDWLSHDIELDTRELNIYFRKERNIELDAERRAVRLIREWKLPVDIKRYTREANAYVYFYEFARRNRLWCQRESPYAIQAIADMMPSRFLARKAYDTVPVGYDALVAQHCIPRLPGSV